MTMFQKLENKYGITIIEDGYGYGFLSSGKPTKQYRIYTADRCLWENGLSYKGVLKECKEHGNSFLKIKKQSESVFRLRGM